MLTAEVARSSILLMRRVTGDNSIRRPRNVARVRRVLFDEPLNHEETRRDLLRETEQLSCEMRHRWNFDFETETPLEGRYEWQRTATTIHPAYELRNLTARLSVPTSTVVSSASSATSDSSVRAELKPVVDPVKSVVNNSTTGSTSTKSTVQKKVTDFMTQRKRPLLKSATSPAPTPKNKVRKTTTTT